VKSFQNDPALRSEYFRDHTIAVDCVELHLDPAIYMCSGGVDLELATETAPDQGQNLYRAEGNFLGFSPLGEEFDVKVGKFSIFLSGIGNSFVERFTNTEAEGKRVSLYKVFLNFGDGTQPLSIVSEPILMFDGVIYNFSISETAKTCQITVDCSSLFADFARTNGRKTSNWSNWLFQNEKYDRAFEKAGFVGQTEFLWGRK